MKTNTKEQIYELLKAKGPVGPTNIARQLKISPQMVHRHLKSLMVVGAIRRLGAPPKVLYDALEQSETYDFPNIDDSDEAYINDNYVFIRADGTIFYSKENCVS